MILSSFKTTSHAEVMYNASHLHVLQYPGDPKLREFYSQRAGMLANMKGTDVPPKESLRSILFRKFDNHTSIMKIDLNMYENIDGSDPDKNLSDLTNMMKRHIDKGQEKMLLQQREKAMNSFTDFDEKAAAAEPDPKAKAKQPKPKAEAKNREAAPTRNRDKTPGPKAAASVLPSLNPKQHAKGRWTWQNEIAKPWQERLEQDSLRVSFRKERM